jgi:hypothetical protein
LAKNRRFSRFLPAPCRYPESLPTYPDHALPYCECLSMGITVLIYIQNCLKNTGYVLVLSWLSIRQISRCNQPQINHADATCNDCRNNEIKQLDFL